MSFSPSRLLVSVRNLEEAQAALAGGCSILDLKEPAAGALGKVQAETLHAVCDNLVTTAPQLPLSAALGEALETTARTLHPLPHALDFVKLGCAGLIRLGTKWKQRWLVARKLWQSQLGPKTGWITVIYADWQQAAAPPPLELLTVAQESGSRGVLIDTFEKDGRGLFDWSTVEQVQGLIQQCREQQLLVALAGSLRRTDIPLLRDLAPDIIAIRGAACTSGDRVSSINPRAIADWVTELQSVPGPPASV